MKNSIYSKRNRRENIKNPAYVLAFEFHKMRKYMGGHATITFDLTDEVLKNKKHLQRLLWIDFRGNIQKIEFNKKKLLRTKDYTQLNGKIAFKTKALALAQANNNVFEISYFAPFGSERNPIALVHFHDALDGNDYYFTKKPGFKPSSLFPCFDQSDILAVHDVRTEAPLDWTVVTSSLCLQTKRLAKAQEWQYEKSIPYPSEQFCFLAGPYDQWLGPPPDDGEIPLIFYGRKSLKGASQWLNLGLCVRHPKDFDYFRQTQNKDGGKTPTIQNKC